MKILFTFDYCNFSELFQTFCGLKIQIDSAHKIESNRESQSCERTAGAEAPTRRADSVIVKSACTSTIPEGGRQEDRSRQEDGSRQETRRHQEGRQKPCRRRQDDCRSRGSEDCRQGASYQKSYGEINLFCPNFEVHGLNTVKCY